MVLLLYLRKRSNRRRGDIEAEAVIGVTVGSTAIDREMDDLMKDVAISDVPDLREHAQAHRTDTTTITEGVTDREVATDVRLKTECAKGIDHGRVTGVRTTDHEVDHLTCVVIGKAEAGIETKPN